ncbi:MAG TPA: S41 family peptidase [Gemmatimonadales bacterium]|nr:S41 family peptidase [Gemmatimonadales bacterium]
MPRCSRALLAALLVSAPLTKSSAQQRTSYEELQTFSQVLTYIFHSYPDSVSYSVLVKSAIDGVLRDLDPHSLFFSRLDYERLDSLQRGILAVTGASLDEIDGEPTVLGVYPQSPAEGAGVRPGDRVLAINDTVVAGLEIETIRLRMAGPAGSKIRVRFARGSRLEPDTFTLALKRRVLEAHSVFEARMVDSTTGFLRLDEFGEKSADEVHDAIKGLRKQGARQIILDLRNNLGGIVSQAVDLVSEFVPKGTIVFSTKGRRVDVDTTYRTRRDGDFRDLPLIVLVNGLSASAAEATAASLQDHDRALIVGRRSFGKALMQTDFFLSSGEVLHMTIGHVISPSGRYIQRRYTGLAVEQYYSLAGRGGAQGDTDQVYHTDAGRVVRGGGGVLPDLVDSAGTEPGAWWVAAEDSGWVAAVADSIAATLPGTPAGMAAFEATLPAWGRTLMPGLLTRIRERLHVQASVDSLTQWQLGYQVGRRVVETRWGMAARYDLDLHHDRDVRMALAAFPRLGDLLKGKAN